MARVEEDWFTPGKAPQPIAFESIAEGFVPLMWAPAGLDDSTGARNFLTQARALASGISERERRRIEIRATQLDAIQHFEDAGGFLAHRKAIDDALNTDTADPQLWLPRGNAEEPTASGCGQRGKWQRREGIGESTLIWRS